MNDIKDGNGVDKNLARQAGAILTDSLFDKRTL